MLRTVGGDKRSLSQVLQGRFLTPLLPITITDDSLKRDIQPGYRSSVDSLNFPLRGVRIFPDETDRKEVVWSRRYGLKPNVRQQGLAGYKKNSRP